MEPLQQKPWSVKIEDIFTALETQVHGLSESALSQRMTLYGANVLQKYAKKSKVTIFLKQLASPLIFILLGAAVVTFLLKEWIEVIVVMTAVLVNAGLGFYREYHAENTLEKLSGFIKDRARVIRDGIEHEVDSEELFPGDIIKVSYGSRVPADARILSTNNIYVDEAILTGESKPIQKNVTIVPVSATVAERMNMLHAGTLVVDGFATAVVVATGVHTEIGKIAGLVSGTKQAKTPIQKGLEKISWIIFAIVIVIVVGIFILGIYRGEPLFDMLILSVAVSVGAVPEALPIALTVILSIGAERIAKKQGVTRTLIAAETLGSTSLIMTDKTGTLTEANMKLVGVYTVKELNEDSDHGGVYTSDDDAVLQLALHNVDVLIENPHDPVSEWTFKGKPFEVHIVKTAREKGIDITGIQHNNASLLIPFNSTHKFSVSKQKHHFVVVGAPDILLARAHMDKDAFLRLETWITEASNEGKRLIAVGTVKELSDTPAVSDITNISFKGILAFHDPIRANVPDAIKKIESLGVRVVMITGDLKGTAIAVGRELGWDVSEDQVITGHDIQSLTDAELLAVIPQKKIFARVTPEDKLRIGLLYRQLGEVVAMTGDGVNDAPALKAMDIGVALGSGSDVAKSVAGLVLLDDNFEIISMAIQEGRRILVNIRKTFVYLMSNSLDEVFVVGGSLIVGIAMPLTALQIIWVNLFTGSLPALAFAYDDDFDHQMYKHRTLKSIFTREVNLLTFGVGVMSSLLLFFTYYGLIRFGVDVQTARSVFFVCFASYILVISYSFRSLNKPLFSYPIFSNKRLNQGILVAIVFLVATMGIPQLRALFDLNTIPLVWFWFIAVWLVANVLLVEGTKYFFRKHK
ncbi:cation-transporting P-type ATPase [Candidatus Nomurabacteria bacterium]|nr:cation-transporting P-type ATPase [Candidatus Nomurabacteria bacterium]